MTKVFFFSLIFTLWLNFFMALRNSLTWRFFHSYPFFLKDLLAFKTPMFLIVVALGLMASYIVSPSVFPKWGETFSLILLWPIGILLFIQGLSIYLKALTFFKIPFFLSLIFLAIILSLGPELLAALGLLDNWFLFDQYLGKNGPKGMNSANNENNLEMHEGE